MTFDLFALPVLDELVAVATSSATAGIFIRFPTTARPTRYQATAETDPYEANADADRNEATAERLLVEA